MCREESGGDRTVDIPCRQAARDLRCVGLDSMFAAAHLNQARLFAWEDAP